MLQIKLIDLYLKSTLSMYSRVFNSNILRIMQKQNPHIHAIQAVSKLAVKYFTYLHNILFSYCMQTNKQHILGTTNISIPNLIYMDCMH